MKVETTCRTDDKTGRDYLVFQPVFRPSVTAHGELRFAEFHAWIDEPENIADIRRDAIQAAKRALESLTRSELQ